LPAKLQDVEEELNQYVDKRRQSLWMARTNDINWLMSWKSDR